MTIIRIRHLLFSVLPLIILTLLFSGCGEDPFRVDYSNVPPPFDLTEADTSWTTSTGLIIHRFEPGSGPFEVVSRDEIFVHYTGRTMEGRIIDSSWKNGSNTPSLFRNLTPVPKQVDGQQPIGTIIPGFREGLLGMKEGEVRTLIIPPHLAYGDSERGSSTYELRDDTLRFDVELARIR